MANPAVLPADAGPSATDDDRIAARACAELYGSRPFAGMFVNFARPPGTANAHGGTCRHRDMRAS